MNTGTNCKNCQQEFEISTEDEGFYKKFSVEPNGLCFECDQKRRLNFRNGRKLYTRKCAATDKQIVSTYSPDKPYKIFRADTWWGDSWDPMDYGLDFDFNRPFFEQFKKLQLKVPRMALSNAHNENSDYCNMTVYNKNCYLVFGGDYNEDVQYGDMCFYNRDSLDIDYSSGNEQSYYLCESSKCYGCQFVFDSKNCNNCYYLSDCSSCSECILCNGLNQKKHCILNKQYSEKEYFERKKELITSSNKQREENWQTFTELLKNRIVKFSHTINSENCSGDYIYNSKNCQNSFGLVNCEDLNNVILAFDAKDLFQSSFVGHNAVANYQTQSCININNCKFAYMVCDSADIEYSEMLFTCNNCFGCCGLKHKNYCILNKQYSKEEYLNLRERIIEHMEKTGEWGQFFPSDLSAFAYNESTAQNYFPLIKEQAIKEGFSWSDYPENKPSAAKTVSANKLPDTIEEVTDEVLSWAIECEKSKRLFKITPQELNFYRKHLLPLPRLHYDERYRVRMSLRNPCKLFSRTCTKCEKPIQTTYPPSSPEIVYCEECYLKEIY